MAQTRTLTRRIRSVKNAEQITKALEVVAASRMRRVVQLVEGSRSYGEMATAIMQRISRSPEAKDNAFFASSTDKPSLYVIFSSDRGQAGAFKSNIFNLALQSFTTEKNRPHLLVFGRKGARFFPRIASIELQAAYQDIADVPEVNVFAAPIRIIEEGLKGGEFGKVILIHTQFISSLNQKASAFQLAPIQKTENQTEAAIVPEFEPDIPDVLDEAIRLYLEAKLMQARIESAASEHAMRMVAMGNANRNAKDLIDDLTLELNATRQAAITQEVAEITGGAAAIAG